MYAPTRDEPGGGRNENEEAENEDTDEEEEPPAEREEDVEDIDGDEYDDVADAECGNDGWVKVGGCNAGSMACRNDSKYG